MGTLDPAVMAYWAAKPSEEMTEFLFSKVADRPKMVGLEKVKVPTWNRITDILHFYGISTRNVSITIEDANGTIMHEDEFLDLSSSSFATLDKVIDTGSATGHDHVMSLTTEKIGFIYEFLSDEDFTLNRLHVQLVKIDDETYVNAWFYGDDPLIDDDRFSKEIASPQSMLV